VEVPRDDVAGATPADAATAPGAAGAELALLGGPRAVSIPAPHFRWPIIGAEEERAVLEQLHTAVSLPGRTGVIEAFEDAFAAYQGLPFAMSTCSGTAALHAAFFALELEPGDEVLAPAYTHLASVLPMLHAQLVPVLCDVDADTGNLDVADAAARISPRTRAIVVTHQYGHVCDMPAVLALAARHDLRVVEDCSHAHGATLDGRLAGTFGDVACFSLQAHKAVVAGEGGVLVTRHPRVFERATLLGHFRRPTAATSAAGAPFVETGYGLKNRLHPLGAALALVQLRKLPETIAGRRANLARFSERLRRVPGVGPLPTAPGADRGGAFRFLVHYRADEVAGVPIDRYLAALQAEGVAEVAAGSLVRPLHLTSIFQTLDDGMYPNGWPRRGRHTGDAPIYRPGDFPRAERFAASTLQFPAFTEPSAAVIDAYGDAMEKVARWAPRLAEGAT